jgi:hypothetical protein
VHHDHHRHGDTTTNNSTNNNTNNNKALTMLGSKSFATHDETDADSTMAILEGTLPPFPHTPDRTTTSVVAGKSPGGDDNDNDNDNKTEGTIEMMDTSACYSLSSDDGGFSPPRRSKQHFLRGGCIGSGNSSSEYSYAYSYSYSKRSYTLTSVLLNTILPGRTNEETDAGEGVFDATYYRHGDEPTNTRSNTNTNTNANTNTNTNTNTRTTNRKNSSKTKLHYDHENVDDNGHEDVDDNDDDESSTISSPFHPSPLQARTTPKRLKEKKRAYFLRTSATNNDDENGGGDDDGDHETETPTTILAEIPPSALVVPDHAFLTPELEEEEEEDRPFDCVSQDGSQQGTTSVNTPGNWSYSV